MITRSKLGVLALDVTRHLLKSAKKTGKSKEVVLHLLHHLLTLNAQELSL